MNFRTISRAVSKTLAAMDRAWRNRVAEYVVRDTLGTRQFCFTVAEAMEWLPYCAGDAFIVRRDTGLIEVSRHQKPA